MMTAPGASASTPLAFPGWPGRAEPFPRVDDHLVEPETSREEVVRGHRFEAMASKPEHGDPHCQLDYLIRAHVAPGYVASTDMLTRFALGADFAPDTCIRRVGTDPATGTWYLEELAFEVVNEQPLTGPRGINIKSEDMLSRGVRRVFGIFVKEGQVKEWRDSWVTLPPSTRIADPTFSSPLPVSAVLDAAEADKAVAQVLIDKKNPVIEQVRKDERRQGEAAGLRQAILGACTLLAIELSAPRLRQIEEAELPALKDLYTQLMQKRAWPA